MIHLIPLYKKRWIWDHYESVKGLTLQNNDVWFFQMASFEIQGLFSVVGCVECKCL